MAIVKQLYLFSRRDCENLGDLERLKLVLENIPDENLIEMLNLIRGNGRNDNPIRAMWNSILAGIIYEHKSIESLRRELKRNAQLRELCGFDPFSGSEAVPSSSAYSRFLASILHHEDVIDAIFHNLVESIRKVLPNFGKTVAFDGKAVES